MKNRIIAAVAALALAPAAVYAEEAAVDLTALEGKVDALAEQYAETKADVAGMKKLKLSGYIQARYAWLEAANYNTSVTGTAPTTPDRSGFFIRRGRFKAVYDSSPVQYVMQIDVIPAGVSIKEGYASVALPFGLAMDAGLQLFPFGYEVFARSSSDLDTLERSRVTSAFLGGEYDLGVALRGKVSLVNFKVGLFNGNGINSGQLGRDNDPNKDVIGRAWVDMGVVTAGVSGWYGKTTNFQRPDDKTYDRNRVAVDVQTYLDLLPFGGTSVKGEWMWGHTTIGSQGTGAASNAGAGGNLPAATAAATVPVPTGSGWYLIGLQNVGPANQLAIRYEQYMPNHTANVATGGTVKVQKELQVAVHTYVGGNYKLSAAWYHPMNGERGPTAVSDPKQDQFLVQAQAKF